MKIFRGQPIRNRFESMRFTKLGYLIFSVLFSAYWGLRIWFRSSWPGLLGWFAVCLACWPNSTELEATRNWVRLPSGASGLHTSPHSHPPRSLITLLWIFFSFLFGGLSVCVFLCLWAMLDLFATRAVQLQTLLWLWQSELTKGCQKFV